MLGKTRESRRHEGCVSPRRRKPVNIFGRVEDTKNYVHRVIAEFPGLKEMLLNPLLQSGGCIQKLIDDVDVVPEIFKELDTELVDLSLKETVELDEKLIKFCKSYPCIFDFSLNEAFDSATEEGFKDIIDEMKKNWFVGIADHYVIVATLLYMKNIYDEA
ncbi:hypothetical protein FCM35_KLT22234 [Carex littledalei]|uniref:Uncharacterized protein n=1 Tax=Carex littledalei TaxID=544730 RepID=A0A833QBX2_9POAL|nr:hypothetical protein FCM35_KLT22234 [Carex littledalei]